MGSSTELVVGFRKMDRSSTTYRSGLIRATQSSTFPKINVINLLIVYIYPEGTHPSPFSLTNIWTQCRIKQP